MWIRVKRNAELFFFSFPRLISRKHAIKPKFFDYRGSLKIFRSANNLYTIQSPNFAFIENLYSCLTQAQNLVKYWGCCAYRQVVRKQVGFQDLKNFFIKKFITAIENTRFEIYLRFIWIQTPRIFYFSRRLFAKHQTFSSLSVGFLVVGLDCAKFGFYQFSFFLFIVVIDLR